MTKPLNSGYASFKGLAVFISTKNHNPFCNSHNRAGDILRISRRNLPIERVVIRHIPCQISFTLAVCPDVTKFSKFMFKLLTFL